MRTSLVASFAAFCIAASLPAAALAQPRAPGMEPSPGGGGGSGGPPSNAPGGGGSGGGGGGGQLWGAIAFTADGSYSSVWRQASKAEAEANVATRCAQFGRGSCETASFPGEMCVALTHWSGTSRRRRWRLSFTAGARTVAEAQKNATARCEEDERVRGNCQLRTIVCGDGR